MSIFFFRCKQENEKTKNELLTKSIWLHNYYEMIDVNNNHIPDDIKGMTKNQSLKLDYWLNN